MRPNLVTLARYLAAFVPAAHHTPVARAGDPPTSWAAAASLDPDELRNLRQRLWLILFGSGGMTHQALGAAYRARLARQRGWKPAEDSSVRTRVSELVRDGFVRDSGRKDSTRAGNDAIIWEALVRSGPSPPLAGAPVPAAPPPAPRLNGFVAHKVDVPSERLVCHVQGCGERATHYMQARGDRSGPIALVCYTHRDPSAVVSVGYATIALAHEQGRLL